MARGPHAASHTRFPRVTGVEERKEGFEERLIELKKAVCLGEEPMGKGREKGDRVEGGGSRAEENILPNNSTTKTLASRLRLRRTKTIFSAWANYPKRSWWQFFFF